MKKKTFIKSLATVFVFAFATVAITGSSKKQTTTNTKAKPVTKEEYSKVPYKYSTVISTENIESVEFCLDYFHRMKGDYNEKYYITLSNEYKDKFITSLNSDSYKFKYAGFDPKQGGYKNFPWNTFIIHHSDGTKTILDGEYVSKFDTEGTRTYYEALNPYECEIDANMFIDLPKAADGIVTSYFAWDTAFYEMKKVEIVDPSLGDGETYYRYYKLVNGCISDDYWDIKYKDDIIISTFTSKSFINCIDVLPITKPGYEYDSTDTTIVNVEKITVYILKNEGVGNNYSVHPIEVNYINKVIEGQPKQETVCIDLNTGETVDYPDFIIK